MKNVLKFKPPNMLACPVMPRTSVGTRGTDARAAALEPMAAEHGVAWVAFNPCS